MKNPYERKAFVTAIVLSISLMMPLLNILFHFLAAALVCIFLLLIPACYIYARYLNKEEEKYKKMMDEIGRE